MENKAYAKTIKHKHDSDPYVLENKQKDTKVLGLIVRSKELRTVADHLAGDREIRKNNIIEGIRTKFPEKAYLWIVEKFYPYAQCGPLYVDEPIKEWELKECAEKIPLMKALGLRYVVIKPHMTLFEALEQLET